MVWLFTCDLIPAKHPMNAPFVGKSFISKVKDVLLILYFSHNLYFDILSTVNPHTPIAQKVADEVVFRRFQGEGVEFFLIELY